MRSPSPPPLVRRLALLGLAVAVAALAAALTPGALPAQPSADRAEAGVPGEPERALFRHLTAEDGLSNEAVAAVLQDRWGFVWIATADGLNRYDGYEIVEHRRGRDSTTLSDNVVSALAEGPDGALWVGTARGLNRFDRPTESFRRFTTANSGLPDGDVIALHADSSGAVWVGTARGLARYDPEADAWAVYGEAEGLPDAKVAAVVPGPEGALWLGTGDGVARLDPATGEVRAFRIGAPGDGLGGDVSSLDFSEQGHLWVGTFGNGLFRLDPEAGTVAPVDLGAVSVISTVYEDDRGTLWVGTFGDGLRQLDPGAPAPLAYAAAEDDPTSLLDDSVSDLYQDRQGVLWVATYGGLDRFDRARGTVARLRHDPQDPASLASNDALSLLAARDGTLYVGTDRSVDVSADGGETFRHLPLGGQVGPAAARALLQDREGAVWAGTEVGLRRVTADGLEPVDLDAVPGGIPIRTLLEGSDRRFFAGTLGGGLALLDRESGRSVAFTHSPDDPGSLAHDNVHSLAEDARGAVWVGTAEGLCRLDRAAEAGRFTCFRAAPNDPGALADGFVQALHARDDGSLWVGTSGGLHRVDTEAPERGMQRFTEAETDLPSDDVLAIVEDDEGFLWLATSRGLTRFEPVTGTFQRRTLGGEGAARTLGAAAARAPDGTLYFGGTNGLLAFEPRQLAALNPNPPQVAITEVLLDNDPIAPGDGAPLEVAAPLAERLALAHDQNDVTFRFVGLHFSDPEQNRYRYRMEGLDDEDEWIDSGRRREVPYPNLDPGRYTFQVEAANADGIWSEPASLEVVVSPPWWRTVWAYLAYVGLFVFGLVRFDRWQRARVLRQERERAERREQEIRAETAEAEARKAEAERKRAEADAERQRAEARAARADAERQRAEAEGKRELEKAFAELKATQTQLVQSEKLASLGQLTAGIAHEIKNPLNFVNNFADLSVELADELGEELHENADKPVSSVLEEVDAILADLRENARRIHEHGTRADRIVKAMLLHSRGSAAEKARVEANRFVEEYANLAYHGARANDKEFQVDLVRDMDPEAGEVEVIPQELGRVLINLLSNAFYAVGQRRKLEGSGYDPAVHVRTRRLTREGQDWVEIRVEDNGTGIPDELREKVFEPFFTTKPTGEGTGLGLSLAYDIVTQGHGGEMTVESEDAVGTAFSIRLPAQGAAPAGGAPEAEAPAGNAPADEAAA